MICAVYRPHPQRCHSGQRSRRLPVCRRREGRNGKASVLPHGGRSGACRHMPARFLRPCHRARLLRAAHRIPLAEASWSRPCRLAPNSLYGSQRRPKRLPAAITKGLSSSSSRYLSAASARSEACISSRTMRADCGSMDLPASCFEIADYAFGSQIAFEGRACCRLALEVEEHGILEAGSANCLMR